VNYGRKKFYNIGPWWLTLLAFSRGKCHKLKIRFNLSTLKCHCLDISNSILSNFNLQTKGQDDNIIKSSTSWFQK
jgi:hypothetical protein